jgi:hypothetical protein
VATQKLDLLFMIDNSSSMGDKQSILSNAVGDLVGRLVNPACVGVSSSGAQVTAQATDPDAPCPPAADGTPTKREFVALTDIHIGVVSSSLGGIGSDACTYSGNTPTRNNNPSLNDSGHLLNRAGMDSAGNDVTADYTFSNTVPTYVDEAGKPSGFLAWDPGAGASPPTPKNPGTGQETDSAKLISKFSNIVHGVNQAGCGFEQQMESWYRFLVDPEPPSDIEVAAYAQGPSKINRQFPDPVIMQQRTDFLRPDSLVAVVVVSDENEHSNILGTIPPQVCETPTFAKDGITPTGCSGDLVPWPDSYRIADNLDSNGDPHPYNWATLQLFADPGQDSSFPVWSGTAACATDPYSPDCKECFTANEAGGTNPGDGCVRLDGTAGDIIDLRQWDQKRRFGWDSEYPVQRYVDGLHEQAIYNAEGYKVQNPLFDDLPWRFGNAAGKRAKMPPRDPGLVVLTTIVGVPWQDIAKRGADGKPDLSLGYKSASSSDPNASIDWSLIVGDPYNADPTKRDPGDPLMLEAQDRTAAIAKVGGKHPVTGETLDDHTWNSINGHEWNALAGADLQYTCFVALETPTDCSLDTAADCDCYNPDPSKTGTAAEMALQAVDNPLCEPLSDPTNQQSPGAGQSAITGSAAFKQYRAHAYSGRRYLQVLQGLTNAGGNAVAASICARNVEFGDPAHANDADLGYRPAVDALIERARTRLIGPFACNGT